MAAAFFRLAFGIDLLFDEREHLDVTVMHSLLFAGSQWVFLRLVGAFSSRNDKSENP